MREALLPSFYTTMAFRDKILELLEEGLKEKPSLFLVDLTITETFKVIVTLDGDNGVNLQDCIDISRAIDNNLDREEQDYALEVASAGVSTPLKMVRQYRKNIGRTLKVKTATETIEALLEQVSDESIVLYDNGKFGDEIAHDGIYSGISYYPTGTKRRFYLEKKQ